VPTSEDDDEEEEELLERFSLCILRELSLLDTRCSFTCSCKSGELSNLRTMAKTEPLATGAFSSLEDEDDEDVEEDLFLTIACTAFALISACCSFLALSSELDLERFFSAVSLLASLEKCSKTLSLRMSSCEDRRLSTVILVSLEEDEEEEEELELLFTSG